MLRASSPQGRFAAGADLVDGLELQSAEAWGKQMFLCFAGPVWLRVHLGLYGMWRFAGPGLEGVGRRRRKADALDDDAVPAPRGAVRLRLLSDRHVADLSGPTACEILDQAGRAAALAKLGPDPLRPDAEPDRAWAIIGKSKMAVGQLLMRQDVVAGIGNIYRAELLFRAGIDPHRPGRDLTHAQWTAMWQDLCALMQDGVKTGQIVTTRPADRPPKRASKRSIAKPITADGVPAERTLAERASGGRATRRGARGYVAHRQGQPCRLCGNPVQAEDMAGRRLYWCPVCQPPAHDPS